MVQVSDLGSDCCEERAVGERGERSPGSISPFSYVHPIPAEHENAPGIQLEAEQNTPVLNRSLAGLEISPASASLKVCTAHIHESW